MTGCTNNPTGGRYGGDWCGEGGGTPIGKAIQVAFDLADNPTRHAIIDLSHVVGHRNDEAGRERRRIAYWLRSIVRTGVWTRGSEGYAVTLNAIADDIEDGMYANGLDCPGPRLRQCWPPGGEHQDPEGPTFALGIELLELMQGLEPRSPETEVRIAEVRRQIGLLLGGVTHGLGAELLPPEWF